MSRKTKTRQAEKRKKEKRSRKDSMKAQYKAWAEAGENKKSKRFLAKNKKLANAKKHQHIVSNCGNAGCMKCFPAFHAVIAKLAGKPEKQL